MQFHEVDELASVYSESRNRCRQNSAAELRSCYTVHHNHTHAYVLHHRKLQQPYNLSLQHGTCIWVVTVNTGQTRRHSESSNPRCIAVNTNHNLDLSTRNRTTKFERFGIIRFWVTGMGYAPNISVKMHLLTLWPWPLTFEPQIHVTSRASQGHSLYQVWTLWDHSFFSYAEEKQTNRQTEGLENPTQAEGGGQLRLCKSIFAPTCHCTVFTWLSEKASEIFAKQAIKWRWSRSQVYIWLHFFTRNIACYLLLQ